MSCPTYGEQFDPRDMREYGPKDYSLGIDTNERRNNKLEYLQRRGPGVAWFLRSQARVPPARVPPAVARWHAQAPSQTAGWPTKTWMCGWKRYVRMWSRAGNGRARVSTMHDAQQEQTGAAGGQPQQRRGRTWWNVRVCEGHGRAEEALVWVHWHDEGPNMTINMAKGGPAGIGCAAAAPHTWPSSTAQGRGCAGRRTRSGKQRRQTGRYATGDAVQSGGGRRQAGWGGEPGGRAYAWQRQWDEGRPSGDNLIHSSARGGNGRTVADLGFCRTKKKPQRLLYKHSR
jgi:hypothetical protein